MYSTAGVSAVSGTTSCASHTLSNSVRVLIDVRLCRIPARACGRAAPRRSFRSGASNPLRAASTAASAFVFRNPLTRKFTCWISARILRISFFVALLTMRGPRVRSPYFAVSLMKRCIFR